MKKNVLSFPIQIKLISIKECGFLASKFFTFYSDKCVLLNCIKGNPRSGRNIISEACRATAEFLWGSEDGTRIIQFNEVSLASVCLDFKKSLLSFVLKVTMILDFFFHLGQGVDTFVLNLCLHLIAIASKIFDSLLSLLPPIHTGNFKL